jgi:hypothetical protein
MLRVAPDQLTRLVELEQDVHRRIELATARGWRGEADGLQTTLAHIAEKKHQVAKLNGTTSVPVTLTALNLRSPRPPA